MCSGSEVEAVYLERDNTREIPILVRHTIQQVEEVEDGHRIIKYMGTVYGRLEHLTNVSPESQFWFDEFRDEESQMIRFHVENDVEIERKLVVEVPVYAPITKIRSHEDVGSKIV